MSSAKVVAKNSGRRVSNYSNQMLDEIHIN